MKKITVPLLLKRYQERVEKGEVQFLAVGSGGQLRIVRLIGELIADFETAAAKGELSRNLNWYDTHRKGRELWVELSRQSLNYIDSNAKGTSDLEKYLGAATDFEDLLYGLEPYYRDHTLHSLWVYLTGDYILRDLLPTVYNDINWYLFNDIRAESTSYSGKLLEESEKIEARLCKTVNEKKDAIWCIIALCHDLGYSLAKLRKLNEKAENVLKFFEVSEFRKVGYSLDLEHQYIVSQFLELMAMDVRIVPSADKKEALTKCYRDDSTYWRLCRAFEKRQHGILSSYLIYKILGIFADTSVRGPAEEWGLEDDEAYDNIVRGDILFAIAQHEFDFAHLSQASSLADILVLADEIEEFSRFGRQMLSREYHDTMAEVGVAFKKAGDGRIRIEVEYDVAKHRELGDFFVRKAERLCRMYSLSEEENTKRNDRFMEIESFSLTARKGAESARVVLNRGSGTIEGHLPATRINGRSLQQGSYALECIDDKMYHPTAGGERISLREWFKNVT